MTQLAMKFLKLLLIVYVFVFAYQWWRPMPDGMTKQSASYMVPDKSVKFYSDLQKTEKNGTVTESTSIISRFTEILQKGGRMAIIGEEYVPEVGTSTISSLLAQKRKDDKHVAIALITDAKSTRYGGVHSSALDTLRTQGVLTIVTDMSAMPDSNLFYTSFWRPFVSWWGNSFRGGWLSDPIRRSEGKFTLRTWLNFWNMKSNESHFLFADIPDNKGVKLVSLFSSADFSALPGSTGATAIEVDDKIWGTLLGTQASVAGISGSGLPSFNSTDVTDASGTLRTTMVDIVHLHDKITALIHGMKLGDQISITSRFISDREIIKELKEAANRNVSVRIILDPNETYLGHKLYGMPNLPVAKELVNATSNGITIRWCDPRALPCESRLIVGKTASSSFLMLGSADLTRRDTQGYNIESVLFVDATADFTAHKDAQNYFEKIWNNSGGAYTVDYQVNKDDTFWKSSLYRMMERTGFSLY